MIVTLLLLLILVAVFNRPLAFLLLLGFAAFSVIWYGILPFVFIILQKIDWNTVAGVVGLWFVVLAAAAFVGVKKMLTGGTANKA